MIDREHFAYLSWFVVGLALAALAGVAVGRPWRGGRRAERLAVSALPAMLYIAVAAAVLAAVRAPENYWNGCRLAPAVGLLYGERIYRPPSSGAVLNTIYPPMAYLPYLPAGLFRRPAAAVMAASCVSMTLFFLPFLALCFARRGPQRRTQWLTGPYVYLGFYTLVMTSPVLFAAGHWVHCDAPAVGFGAAACVALYLARPGGAVGPAATAVSCLAAGLAVWSKQTMAPLVAALPVWVLLSRGVSASMRYGFAMGASLAVLTVGFRSTFGVGSLVFNILRIPAAHPWKYQGDDLAFGLTYQAIELLFECLPVLVATLIVAASGRRRVGGDRRTLAEWLAANGWALFAFAALTLVPMAVLGKIKAGGVKNNDAPTLYLLCCALAALVLDRVAASRRAGIASLVILVSFSAPVLLVGGKILPELVALRPVSQYGDERAFRFARAHPGVAYFPWNPLSSLLAERRLYHFEFGLFDRNLGGYPVGPEHFRRHVPASLRLVCFPPNRQAEWTMRYLPEFNHRVDVPGLPDWICYAR